MTSINEDPEQIERWTAKRKFAVVIESLQDDVTEEEVCQKYGLTRSEFRN